MSTDEKIIRRMTQLFLKEVFGELTREEQKELNNWIQTDSSNRAWYEQMKTLEFVEKDNQYYTRMTQPEQAWMRLEKDMDRRNMKSRKMWIYYSSAAIIVLFLCSILFLQWSKKESLEIVAPQCVHELALVSLVVDSQNDSISLGINKNVDIALAGVRNENNALIYDTAPLTTKEVEFHTLIVGRGGEYQLTLSDGTVVWLNSESSLRYPVHFTGERREVELKGEGFFKVNHDEAMPFIVKSGDFDVEVLGTSFDIMNYKDERYARVTLATGKLKVSKGDKHAVIHPDQQVQLGRDEFEVRDVDARYYTSWIESKFMFDDESLEVIVRKLARWYNLDYEFKDTTLTSTRFSGQLLKYHDITKAFELLEMTTDVHFTINQKTILIMRKGK